MRPTVTIAIDEGGRLKLESNIGDRIVLLGVVEMAKSALIETWQRADGERRIVPVVQPLPRM